MHRFQTSDHSLTSPIATRSRRAVLRGLLFGGVGLLTACGSVGGSASANHERAFLSTGDDGALAQPALAPSLGQPAKAVLPSSSRPASGIGGATVVVASPSSTATATQTSTPTATSTPRPTATPTLTPTPTAMPYDESKLTHLLGQSITSYAGSIASRVTNVRLATKNINGATVAPGAVFSFDSRVGPQTTAAGFEVAWGIVNRNGQPMTVPSVAGGICQVATTLFQAVYWAGLSIVQRHHHLYWIDHYGSPPYGQVGLDATVDFPPVDFQFRNTTSDWVRVVGTYDATHVQFRVYGVDQGWKVTSSKTKITNLVKTDRTTIERPDPTKPYGYKLWIEAAADAFDASVERLVTKNGKVVDRYDFTNHYDAAHNVLLVGTKGAPATATATATKAPPSATATPHGAPKPSPTPVVNAGQVRLPSMVGMDEPKARSLITSLKLTNSNANYQGKGDIPDAARQSVPVGHVLSQLPAPGTVVAQGTTIHLAVRKN